MRLIDADKINPMRCPRSIEEMRKWIDEQPTVDAVEVVRCKDCIHEVSKVTIRYCLVWRAVNGFGDDGFCNYGERK